MTDKKLLTLMGKKYDSKTEPLLRYGGEINSKGRIVRVITKKEYNQLK
ncbi:MAG: hypothetical protein NT038_03640 [Euryarchaeota archaeon]|nr:hypothetical protein [Euryarchaeota archaeon]